MFDRREFLKLFGVGASVVPIIGGIPLAAAESKLIEVPKLEPVAKSTISGFSANDGTANIFQGPCGLTLILDDPLTGKRTTLIGKTFVLSTNYQFEQIGYGIHDYVKHKAVMWEMKGEMLPDEKGEIGTITTEFLYRASERAL